MKKILNPYLHKEGYNCVCCAPNNPVGLRGHIASQRRNIVTIHLTLENSQGEVCDEGEAIYFTFGPDKAKEMGFDSCKVEGEE